MQELQVCDESQQVMVTRSLDSRILGGTTRMELARINTAGASSLKPALPNQWSMAAYQRDLSDQPGWVQRVLSKFD